MLTSALRATAALLAAIVVGRSQPRNIVMTFPTMPDTAAGYRIKIGQRFYRVGYTAVIWQAMSVYSDAQGHEHATLVDEAGCLDKKTLSASVLLDRSQYQLI